LQVGGDLRGDENRKAWINRVARMAGISPRLARSAWYEQIKDPEHKVIWKLKRALEARAQQQEAAAQNEYRELQERLERLERRLLEIDPGFLSSPADEVRETLLSGGSVDLPGSTNG
jgi:hypothetical protein